MSRKNKISKEQRSIVANYKDIVEKLSDEELILSTAAVAKELSEKKINRKMAVAKLSIIASEINRRANPVKPFDKIKIKAIPMPIVPTEQQAKQEAEVIQPL